MMETLAAYFFGKELKRMQITERDKEIVRFLEKFGFGTAEQVERYIGASEYIAWRRMKKLVESGYLRRERIFHEQAGVYLVTSQWLDLAGSERKSPKLPKIATYDHDLTVLDIAIFFHLQEHEIVSEKELRWMVSKGIGERGTREHVPDLALKKDGKVVAVEFENSPKSVDRMTKILRFFALAFFSRRNRLWPVGLVIFSLGAAAWHSWGGGLILVYEIFFLEFWEANVEIVSGGLPPLATQKIQPVMTLSGTEMHSKKTIE